MGARSSAVHVTDISKIPNGEHWAILENNSIHIPGDERSRTNPGHGYPESTEHVISYTAYTDKTEFETELIRQIEQSRGFGGRQVRGIHVIGIATSKTIITLEEKS